MVSDYIKVGTKIDIMPDDVSNSINDEEIAVFHSMVQDIFSNGDLEVDMPTSNGKLILLHNGMRYRMVFYTDKATYVATAKVVERYKSNNMFLLRVRLVNQLERFQRREYFRCECTLDMKYRELTEEELQTEQDIDYYIDDTNALYREAVALDISGGGIRFTSRIPSKSGSILRIGFTLAMENQTRDFLVEGRVLSSHQIEGTGNRYENRVQFTRISNEEREVIIRYIFEQERKSRKLGRG